MNEREKFVGFLELVLARYRHKLDEITHSAENSSTFEKEYFLNKLESIKQKFKEVEQAYQNLKSAPEEKWEEMKENISAILKAFKDSFTEVAGEGAFGKMGEFKEEVVDYTHKKFKELSACIEKRPVTSACWAFAIGFILGRIFRLR